MKQRCLNPKSTAYPNYGALGVTICSEWMDFERFLADMGERPKGTSLDRIDPWGDYEPSNCRWVDRTVQRMNQRASSVHPEL